MEFKTLLKAGLDKSSISNFINEAQTEARNHNVKLNVTIDKKQLSAELKQLSQQIQNTKKIGSNTTSSKKQTNELKNQKSYYNQIKQNLVQIGRLEKENLSAGNVTKQLNIAQIKELQTQNNILQGQIKGRKLYNKVQESTLQSVKEQNSFESKHQQAKLKDIQQAKIEKDNIKIIKNEYNKLLTIQKQLNNLKIQSITSGTHSQQELLNKQILAEEKSLQRQKELIRSKGYNKTETGRNQQSIFNTNEINNQRQAILKLDSAYSTLNEKLGKLKSSAAGITEQTNSDINRILNDLNGLSQRITNLSSITSTTKFNTELKEITQLLHSNSTELSGLQTQTTQYKNNLASAKLSNNIQESLRRDTALTKEAKEAMRQWVTELNSGSISSNHLSSINSQFQSLKNGYKELSSSNTNMFSTLVRNASKFVKWNVAVWGSMEVWTQLGKSMSNLKEVDTLLTEISKTSNSTKTELLALGKASYDTASKYGVTNTKYLTGVQEMNRSGFYNEQGNKMAQLSLLAQSAGDMEADLANSYILSTNASYNLKGNTEELNKVLDGQNEITNRNSVNMTDMADATSKAGSMASNAGVKINELSAMIGTIEASTKEDSAKVGTGLKTLFVNLQDSSSSKIVNTLKSVGVAMTQTKNGIESLRTPTQILRDLAKVYNTLPTGDLKKALITENIGGKHHANELSALLSNWDSYDKMVKDYSEGSGSALKESQKSANNLTGSLNKLSNAWNEIVSNILSSDFLTSVVKGGTTVLKTITSISEGLNKLDKFHFNIGKIGFAGIITGISGVNAAMNNMSSIKQVAKTVRSLRNIQNGVVSVKGIDSTILMGNAIKGLNLNTQIQSLARVKLTDDQIQGIATELQLSEVEEKLFIQQVKLNSAIQQGNPIQRANISITKAFSGAMEGLGVACDTAKIAFKSFLASTVIGLAIGVAISTVYKFIEAIKEGYTKAHPSIETVTNALKTQSKAIETITDKIDKYNQTLNSNTNKINEFKNAHKGKITINNKEAIKNLKEENKQLQTKIDYETIEAQKQANNLKKTTDKSYKNMVKGSTAENSLERLHFMNYSNNGTYDISTEKGQEQAEKAQKKLQKKIDEYKKLSNNGDVLSLATSMDLNGEYKNADKTTQEDAKNEIQSLYKSYTQNLKAYQTYLKASPDAEDKNEVQAKIKILKQGIESYSKWATKYTQDNKLVDKSTRKTAQTISSFGVAWKLFASKKDAKKLAETGELTVDAFNGLKGSQTLLKNTGLTVEEVTQKINKMADSVTQLVNMRSQISSMSSALETKKTDKFVTVDTLNGFSSDVKGLKVWKEYKTVMGDSTTSMAQAQRVSDKLATQYVNSNNFLSNLTKTNKQYYITQLKSMGIANAREVVEKSLSNILTEKEKSEINARLASIDLSKTTDDEVKSLMIEANQLSDSSEQLKYYALQKIIANNNGLDTSDEIDNLMLFAKQLGITGKAIRKMSELQTEYSALEHFQGSPEEEKKLRKNIDKTAQELQTTINKKVKVNTKVKTNINPTSSSKSSSTSKNKSDDKQEIDWIARLLDVLQKKIDLTNAKLSNLFNIKTQNNNVQTQIKETTKLLNANIKASDRYMYYANKVKLSSSLKEKVRNGDYTIENYSSKTQDKIQKYEDLIDKAKSSQQAVSTTLTSILELYAKKIENITNYYDKLTNAISSTNEVLSNQLSYTKALSSLNGNGEIGTISEYLKLANNQVSAISNTQSEISDYKSARASERTNTVKVLKSQGTSKSDIKSYKKTFDAETKSTLNGLQNNIYSAYSNLMSYANELASLPWDKASVKIEKLSSSYELLGAKIKNGTSAKQKNNLIDKEDLSLTKQLEVKKSAIAQEQANLKKYAKLTGANGTTAISDTELEKLKNTSTSAYKNALLYNATLEKLKTDTIALTQSQEEYITQIADNAVTQFQNIESEYNTIISNLEAKLNHIQAIMSRSAIHGFMTTQKQYESEITNTRNQLEELQQEKMVLENTLNNKLSNGEIIKGTDQYNTMISEIQTLDSSIDTATTNLEQYLYDLSQLNIEANKKIESVVDSLVSANNMYKTIAGYEKQYNDNGSLTSYGQNTIDLLNTNLDLYISKLSFAKDSLEDIQKQYDSGNVSIESLTEAQETYNSSLESAYETAQNIKEVWISALEQSATYLKEQISDYTDALDKQKSLSDYQKNIADENSNIDLIEKQILALSGGNSEEVRNKVQQLKNNLKDAQDKLSDTTYSQYILDQKNILSNLEEEYNDFITDTKEDLQSYLDNYLASESKDIATIQTNLANGTYTSILAEETGLSQLPTTLNNLVTVLEELKDKLETDGNSTSSSSTTNYTKSGGTSEGSISTNTTSSSTTSSTTSTQGNGSINIGDVITCSADSFDYKLHTNSTEIGNLSGAKGSKFKITNMNPTAWGGYTSYRLKDEADNSVYWVKGSDISKKFTGFSSGGIGQLVKSSGEDGFAMVRNGEGFIAPEDVKYIQSLLLSLPALNNISSSVTKGLDTSVIANNTNSTKSTNIDTIEVNIDGSGITDVESFKNVIKQNSSVRQMINDITLSNLSDSYGNLNYLKR